MEQTVTDYQDHKDFLQMIAGKKYYDVGETCWEDIVERITNTLETSNDYDQDFTRKINQILIDKKFIPGGSILYGMGRKEGKSSLSNCYYRDIKDDSIESIYEWCRDAARTFSYRGGIGVNLTVLRPKTASVENAAISSSGAVSFLPMLSAVVETMGQNGRRGAAIGMMHIRHPDIEDFIFCKSHPEKVFNKDIFGKMPNQITSFNLSVLITDEFMEAVKNDGYWELKFPDIQANKKYYNENWNGDYTEWKGELKTYKVIKARELWHKISQGAWSGAEPGVVFWDTVKRLSVGEYDNSLKIRGLNPCGEQQLANNGSCNLGAINLFSYVKNPWGNTIFDWAGFKEDIHNTTEFMDAVIDLNTHPLKEQTEKDLYGRKIGIGVMGMADTLAALGYLYGEADSINFIDRIFSTLKLEIIKSSYDLMTKKGACPALNTPEKVEKYWNQEFFKSFTKEERQEISHIIGKPLRNYAHTTVAPTGTTSMIAGVTGGLEPLFSVKTYRKTRLKDTVTALYHFPILEHAIKNNIDLSQKIDDDVKILYKYVEAHEVDWKSRVIMQSVIQKHLTDSISSTVNLSADTTIENIQKIYEKAWEYGLKGITVYRDGSIGAVISKTDDTKESVPVATDPVKNPIPLEADAKRYKVAWNGIGNVYIIVVTENGKPMEIFSKLPEKAGHGDGQYFDQALYMERISYWDNLCRQISCSLRWGVPLEEIIKNLERGTYGIGHVGAVLFRILKKYLTEDEEFGKNGQGSQCPSCGENGMRMQDGCKTCQLCGYSKCM